jgi:hypothetical protein
MIDAISPMKLIAPKIILTMKKVSPFVFKVNGVYISNYIINPINPNHFFDKWKKLIMSVKYVNLIRTNVLLFFVCKN